MNTLKLYRHPLSGHSHRVELMLSLLHKDHDLIDVDLLKGEHRSEAFLAINLFGQVPVLGDGDTVIADSNAILIYLASVYDTSRSWLPEDPVTAAEVQRFLSVAAGPVASGPATARLINVFGASNDKTTALDISRKLFDVLESHLQDRDWLVGGAPTIADVANYTYIAHAPEGDVDLGDYTHLRAWLRRIEALPGFVPMQDTAVGLAA